MVGLSTVDERLLILLRRVFVSVARVSIFVIFFWFGLLKIIGESPASPLAEALVGNTFGLQHFDLLFYTLAVLECLVGVLFLFPQATRIVIPLLFFHMVVVCSPLILVYDLTWLSFLVPTLEGQYIIKNVVVIAVAIGIAAQLDPLKSKNSKK